MKYKTGQIKEIKENLSSENKLELEKFGNYILETNKPSKVDKVFRLLLIFYDVTKRNLYEKPTAQDLSTFFIALKSSEYKPTYKRDFLVWLKKFFLWKWEDLAIIRSFPDNKNYPNTSQKVTESDLLTIEEVKELLEGEKNIMYQALVSLIAETGCRPEELLKLKFGDLNFVEE